MDNSTDDDFVTVCAECLRASCIQGADLCEAWRTATAKQMRRRDLRELDRESSDYWDVPGGAPAARPQQ